MILSCAPSYSCKSNKKRKEKKRNIDNDLAVLPSHDILGSGGNGNGEDLYLEFVDKASSSRVTT